MAEHAVAAHARAYGVPALSARIFMVYGPREPHRGAHAVVTGIYRAAASAGKPAPVFGDGSQTRDFVHVTDVARALALACLSNRTALQPVLATGGAVNVGVGVSTKISSLAEGTGLAVARLPARHLDLRATRASTCRARSVLGFVASVPAMHVFAHLREPFHEETQDAEDEAARELAAVGEAPD